MLLADKGYDANSLRQAVQERGAWANIPPKANRKDPICFSPYFYRARNHVDIDQSWRLSRLSEGIVGVVRRWRETTPRRRGCSDGLEVGYRGSVSRHQFCLAGAGFDQAAA